MASGMIWKPFPKNHPGYASDDINDVFLLIHRNFAVINYRNLINKHDKNRRENLEKLKKLHIQKKRRKILSEHKFYINAFILFRF